MVQMDNQPLESQVRALLSAQSNGITFEQFQKEFATQNNQKWPHHIQTVDQLIAQFPSIIKIIPDKKGNQKLMKLNPKLDPNHAESTKSNHKFGNRFGNRRKPIKVKTPEPLKSDFKVSTSLTNKPEVTGSTKPLIARRLIGIHQHNHHAHPQHHVHSKPLSVHSKPFIPERIKYGLKDKDHHYHQYHYHHNHHHHHNQQQQQHPRNSSPSFRSKLLELTCERSMGKPVYESFTTISKHKSVAIYLSKVTVDSQYWSSHPMVVQSPDEAEEMAAKKAYVELSRRFQTQLGDHLHTESMEERRALVQQIVSIVRLEPFMVMFSTAIPEKYFQKYKQPIPQNWLEIVELFPRDLQIDRMIFSNTTRINVGIPTAAALKQLDQQNGDQCKLDQLDQTTDRPCVNGECAPEVSKMEPEVDNGLQRDLNNGSNENHPNQNELSNNLKHLSLNGHEAEGSKSSKESNCSAQLLPPNLELPATAHWNVVLLEAKNNQEIIMRLADTSDQYLDFLDQLCALYQQDTPTATNNKYQVSKVISGRIYAAVFNGCTLRVQAMQNVPVETAHGDDGDHGSMDNKSVECMYVDEAGIEHIPMASLREIPEDLLQLPFQAFSVALANLKTCEHDARVADLLQKMIQEAESGLVLVAQPTCRSHPIQVLLYDTSGATDIVVNDLLREMVINLDKMGVQQLPPPTTDTTPQTNDDVVANHTQVSPIKSHQDASIDKCTDGPTFSTDQRANEKQMNAADSTSPQTGSGQMHTEAHKQTDKLDENKNTTDVNHGDNGNQATIRMDADKEDNNGQQLAYVNNNGNNTNVVLCVKPLPNELCGAKNIPPAQLPEVNPRPKCSEEFWYVKLSVPVSPHNFVLHEHRHANEPMDAYGRLCNEMQEFYEEEEPIELHGSLILARQLLAIKDQDGRWKRARVHALLAPEPNFSVLVQLLDEGGVRVLGLNQVQPLYTQFAQLPIQAMRASLHDVTPMDSDWSPLAVYQFAQLVNNDHQPFRAIVHQIMQVDGEPLLQVTLYRQTDGSSVSDDLVKLNLARKL